MADASPGPDLAIETRGLTKTFGRQRAVDDLYLAVPRGSVFGFLGPNGSGKTTTIRLLMGLASSTAGVMRMLGEPMPARAAAVLPRVGALVEGPGFLPFLSGRDNLRRFDAADRHTAPATRNERVDRALARVGLENAAHKKAHAYSLGMKQRLGIANALLAPRELMILDEPTNGLDPQGTREVRSLIRSLADEGTTIFVSSHLLSEIEQLCSHVAVMSAGRLAAQGTLAEFRGAAAKQIVVRTPDAERATAELAALGLSPVAAAVPPAAPGAAAGAIQDESAIVTADLPAGPAHPEIRPEDVTRRLVEAGVRVRGIAIESESLEQRFVALTGEGFDVAG